MCTSEVHKTKSSTSRTNFPFGEFSDNINFVRSPKGSVILILEQSGNSSGTDTKTGVEDGERWRKYDKIDLSGEQEVGPHTQVVRLYEK